MSQRLSDTSSTIVSEPEAPLSHAVSSSHNQVALLTIIMSRERQSKRRKTETLQETLSSRLSRAPTPTLIDIDPSSDNDMATTNAGTR